MGRGGYTLIELAIVVVMVGILATIALPKFGALRLQWKLESAAQQLVGDLHRARVEAVKRNDMVFVARDGPASYTIRFVGTETLPEETTFTGPDTVKFAPFGPALTGAATFAVSLRDQTKNVYLNAAGFASVQ